MRRISRLTAVLLALFALLVGLLTTSCGGEEKAGSTLTYWANPMTAQPEKHREVLQRVLADFTAETGIRVKIELQDWAKVYPKIVSGIASRSLPDVFDTGSTWAASLQATGGLMEFDDAAFAAIGGRDRFVEASMASTGVPGPTSAVVPLYGMAYGLFYNPTMFAEAGIEGPPQTWSEFVSTARKLTKKGQWGLALGGASSLSLVHHAFIMGRQNGSELFAADGRPTFDTPQERAAVRRLLDLMAVEKVIDPSMIEKNNIDAVTAFSQGKAGMVLAQSAAVNMLGAFGFDDFKVAEAPVLDPLPDGGVPTRSMVAGTNLAVSADTMHRDAALKLVNYLTGDKAQTALNEAFGTVPVTTSVQSSARFADPNRRVFARVLSRFAEPMPMVPNEGAMETVLGEELVKLWPKAATGELTDADVAQALHRAEQKMPRR